MARCAVNTELTGQLFFPEYFRKKSSDLHRQVIAPVDDPREKKVVIAAPRGLGKSTTIAVGHCGRSILFKQKRFILYISNSLTNAEMWTENLKSALQTSEFVRAFKPGVNIAKVADGAVKGDENFSKKAWSAYGHTLVMPRGMGQRIRGLNYRGRRPDLIVVDDLEDREQIRNEENRKKVKQWFYSELLPVVEQDDDAQFKIVYIDTLKHEDSLLAELLESQDWSPTRLSLCDEKYNSHCPNFMSTATVKRMVEEHKAKGELDIFYREYMSEPVAAEDAVFKPEYFKYYNEVQQGLDKDLDTETIVIVDPAKTAKASSAPTAIVTVGINVRSNAIYVRDVINERMDTTEILRRSIEQVRRYRAVALGVELTGLDLWVEQPFRDALGRSNTHTHFVPLTARKARGELGYEDGKVGRVGGLSSYYRQGLIFHNDSGVCDELELQLRSYPRSKRWDIMDALAYTLEILDYGERVMWPERATESGYSIEQEYADLERLEYMPALEVEEDLSFQPWI